MATTNRDPQDWKVIEQLQTLGFSQYEAQAYVALLNRSPLTGYELAQESGVPRANIYRVLRKLEEKNAVLRTDSSSSSRYAPVPSDELLSRLGKQFSSSIEAARESLAQVEYARGAEAVANIDGYTSILAHAQGLIDSAKQSLVLALWPTESKMLADAVKKSDERGVELISLCMAGCSSPCEHCRDNVYRYPMAPEQDVRWLFVIPDEQELLAGSIQGEQNAQGVRTRQKMLVKMVSWYIRQHIAVAALMKRHGSTIDKILDEETRRTFQVVGPPGEPVDWLDYMRGLLSPHHSLDISERQEEKIG